MPALDLSKSVFADARSIQVVGPAAADTTWRSYAISSIASLTRVAVLSLTLVVSASYAQPAFPSNEGAAARDALLVAAKERRESRSRELMNLYKQGLLQERESQTWTSPGLVVHQIVNGIDIADGRPLYEREGVDIAGIKNRDSLQSIGEIESLHQRAQGSSATPAAALVVPHAFFQPTSLPAGSVCSVHVNAFIAPVHDMLRLSTGFSDQVVRDFVIRHELAHCGEHASRNDYLVAKLRGEAAPAGVTITDKAAALYDSVAASQFRGSNAVVEGKLRKSMLDAMEQVGSDMITLQGEEYADGFAALTLLKEGRIKVDDLSQIAEFRRAFWEKDPVHDSSSLLVNLLDQLRLHPELLQGWQESHIRDQATGRSLQISDLQSWYVPFCPSGRHMLLHATTSTS